MPDAFPAPEVLAGQAVYSRSTLRAYDIVVLGVSNRLIWKCPTPRLLGLYDRHVTPNHLDVGVGTGYFLDHCRFPAATPRIGLLDLNRNALEFASRRIARYSPQTHLRNVLEPVTIDTPGFDSVGLNYLLHCLPGSIDAKAVVFDHLAALMTPQAVVFGSTLLQGGVPRSGFAKRLMEIYNRKGIFCNRLDDLDGLRLALERRFRSVAIDVVGCAALFAARSG